MRSLRILYNKYFLTAVGFAVLMLFFDQNDWFAQQEKKRELQETKDAIAFLQRQVDTLDGQYAALRNNPQALEQYAREHYLMKKDGEDVFIIEDSAAVRK
jgi:cell division protein FtsB